VKSRVIALVLVVIFGATGRAFGDEVVDGQLGPGALYRMVRPTVWNGSLLLYAHGFVRATLPVALPAEADLLIGQFTAQGFAVAYSSFSENGWAVKDGAQRTHQLLGVFRARFGLPSRVYLAGASMGGLIAIKLQEQYPGVFDGVLTVCGVAGGTRQLFDYYAHTRALFDLLYPAENLPGDAGGVPTGIDIQTAIAAPAEAAMIDSFIGASTIAVIDQTPVPFANAIELAWSIITALGAHAGSFTDLVPELHGKAYFENRGVRYTSALLPPETVDAINDAVDRFDAAPAALNYMEHYYEPTGQLTVPLIMMSMSRDPVVPAFNQASYLARVTAAGQSDLLVQRTVDGYGHCPVPAQDIAQAFADLVGWVEFGVKPLP
jgi:pimeloyl-ACP methyl ester carboxylesterase